MKFIEMTGSCLSELVKDDELHADDLKASGLKDDTIVRINQQGDIELRRADRWDVIGGLIRDFAEREKAETGLDWAYKRFPKFWPKSIIASSTVGKSVHRESTVIVRILDITSGVSSATLPNGKL